MQIVKFKSNCAFGKKGEERKVTDRAASEFFKSGLIEPFLGSEVKEVVMKEEKAEFETKEEKAEVKSKGRPKITKAPKF